MFDYPHLEIVRITGHAFSFGKITGSFHDIEIHIVGVKVDSATQLVLFRVNSSLVSSF